MQTWHIPRKRSLLNYLSVLCRQFSLLHAKWCHGLAAWPNITPIKTQLYPSHSFQMISEFSTIQLLDNFQPFEYQTNPLYLFFSLFDVSIFKFFGVDSQKRFVNVVGQGQVGPKLAQVVAHRHHKDFDSLKKILIFKSNGV